ncbi:MAG: hypothetical protein HQK88_14210 [Nitrospirae bacterium]|nr:hypothetical protein [Nitrospirota bacterium]MBF0536084.1 hypothetical protein [Nitrospirota bacterium]MBF0617955.1 hypothetical protein [Nitrospirota bacterium]
MSVLAVMFFFKGVSYAETPQGESAESPVIDVPKPVKYQYSSSSRRDPFMSIITFNKRIRAGTKENKKRRVLTPLETVDLDSIRLLGVLCDTKGKQHVQCSDRQDGDPKEYELYGLVTITGGKYFVVRKGMPMGPNGGVVSRIYLNNRNEDNLTGIVVKEDSTDPYGRVISIKRKIRLRTEEEEVEWR